MSCVIRSPSCSQIRMSRARSLRSGKSRSISVEQVGGAQDVAAGLLEEVEELAVARGEDAGEPHAAARQLARDGRRRYWRRRSAPARCGAPGSSPASPSARARRRRWRRGRRPRAGARPARRRAPARRRRAWSPSKGMPDAARVDELDARRGLALRTAGACGRTRAARASTPVEQLGLVVRPGSGRKLRTSERGEPWQ